MKILDFLQKKIWKSEKEYAILCKEIMLSEFCKINYVEMEVSRYGIF